MDADMRPSDTPIALACVPGAIPSADRAGHFALLKQLFAEKAEERSEVAGGYAFRFDAASFADVARFVGQERLCCPFLSFRLDIPARAGPIWLRVTGPDGTRELLDAEVPASG